MALVSFHRIKSQICTLELPATDLPDVDHPCNCASVISACQECAKIILPHPIEVCPETPYNKAIRLYAASRSRKQSEGCRSSLFTAGFTWMWNDARSPASFGPITLVNRSTVVLKSLACICCNSTAIVMSNNPLSLG